MLIALVATAYAGPALADAADGSSEHAGTDLAEAPELPGFPGPDGVVGGRLVEDGRWDDAVALMSGGFATCTGTLVGPRVVLTAGHCLSGGGPTEVKVGAKNWWTDEGEVIGVADVIEYPDSQSTYDIGIVLLEKASKATPRPIALDCVLDEHLEDGAKVQIVGFGVTREDGQGFNTDLNEAPSRVLDKGCRHDELDGIATGCHDDVRPAGEIAAGGDGTDACFGDSGGPLYLKTDEGAFLVGVTSRAFIGVDWRYPCRDGGIWVRPDAVIDWIEEQVGNRKLAYPVCNEAPEVDIPELEARRNHAGATLVAVSDPDGSDSDVTVEIVEPPEFGEASVEGLEIVYEPHADYVGEDELVVAVTDGGAGNPRTGRPVTVEVSVPIVVAEGCGCASGGASGAWAALGAGLLFVRRRR